ncbi:hypothetical protein J2789_004305 [Variovorax paradoxus]|nr:hypothetical protein [Variovorax paradoxus]MDR6521618.1 hypothetical protein [Variovorax paradoxus]
MNYEAMAEIAVTIILTLQANALGGALLVAVLLAFALVLHVRKK